MSTHTRNTHMAAAAVNDAAHLDWRLEMNMICMAIGRIYCAGV